MNIKNLFGRFSLEPYKMFSADDFKKSLMTICNGKFKYDDYVRNTKPDRKFGHNKFDYFCQIPLIGFIFSVLCLILLMLIVYPSIFIQQCLNKSRGECINE